MPLLGAHVSISGGVYHAPQNGVDIGCDAIQIFTKNQRQWDAKPLAADDVEKFKSELEQSAIRSTVVHDSYLINLCSPKKETYQKSLDAFKDELDRAEALGIPYLVFHPGSHLKKSLEWGIKTIADSLNKIHQQTENYQVMSLLETTAGQGTNIGYRFEHLRDIIAAVETDERVGVCVDTCHIFAAGYDLTNEDSYEHVWQDFDEVIGLERLKVFHLNDSKHELDSRKDRHTNIGDGYLGEEAFRLLVNDARFKDHPMILETPGGADMYRRDLKLLRKMTGQE